jgi:hypothetical protein
VIDEEYKEDIFVGYRWTDKVKSEKRKVKNAFRVKSLHASRSTLHALPTNFVKL